MIRFKPGDKIRRIRPSITLKKGTIYTVLEYEDTSVKLTESTTHSYDPAYFELVIISWKEIIEN